MVAKQIVKTGPVTINIKQRSVHVDGREVLVSGGEWKILRGLAKDAGMFRSTDELACLLYPKIRAGSISESERRAVRITVARLRRRIGVDELIQTRPTMGYRILPMADRS